MRLHNSIAQSHQHVNVLADLAEVATGVHACGTKIHAALQMEASIRTSHALPEIATACRCSMVVSSPQSVARGGVQNAAVGTIKAAI